MASEKDEYLVSPVLESQVDSRGIPRGECSLCGCDQYNGEEKGKKCVDCGHAPGQHEKLSPDQSSQSPEPPPVHQTPLFPNLSLQSEEQPSPDQICIYKGCNRVRYRDKHKTHEFCGKTHARRYQENLSDSNPDNKCKTPGCRNPRYQKENGEYFDYCSLYCRDNQQEEGQKMLLQAEREACALPGCIKPRYQDPSNGRIHEYCSRSHSTEARQSGITGGISIRAVTGQEFGQVEQKFRRNWSSGKGACPEIEGIFSISNAKLQKRWSTYQATLAPLHDTEEYFHGTKLKCNIRNTNTLCPDSDCGICGIANIGFDRRCIRKNITFQRFGHGFYLAPNSSKCHDYTQGCSGYRAMLLFDVCPGIKYQLRSDDEKLTAPPAGHNSVHGKAGGSLNYDELVLYNPDGALPKYIIVYTRDGEGKIAK